MKLHGHAARRLKARSRMIDGASGWPVPGREPGVLRQVPVRQIVESVAQLRELGAVVSTAVCVIDRQAGGVENPIDISVQLRSLFSISDLRDAASTESSPRSAGLLVL